MLCMDLENKIMKVFVNTWKNYNENGADGGEWIALPMEDEELDEVLESLAEKLGEEDPEWFINDYSFLYPECEFDISENEEIEFLNEMAQKICELDSYDIEKFEAAMEVGMGEVDEVLRRLNDIIFYSGMTMEEVAYEIVEECYFDSNTPDFIRRYFDYEAFARDLSFEDYTETKNGVICWC